MRREGCHRGSPAGPTVNAALGLGLNHFTLLMPTYVITEVIPNGLQQKCSALVTEIETSEACEEDAF